MNCTLKKVTIFASSTGARNHNDLSVCPSEADEKAKMSLAKCVCVCVTFLNMGTEGPKHGSFTAAAASHMDHLTCKTQRSASGNYCHPALESNLKALFEIAGAISNFFRGNVFVRNKQRLAKVASPNSTLTVLREQWGLCWDSRENQSCADALSETAAHPQILGKKADETDHSFENKAANCRNNIK